ncbi:hypothetical protein [Xenorhabdus bharatensis]|uniref:hypothetical protein n=1 Tax=Xenorhabdus bharatensis TaxID=3136256 RepID=UPI0030F41F36
MPTDITQNSKKVDLYPVNFKIQPKSWFPMIGRRLPAIPGSTDRSVTGDSYKKTAQPARLQLKNCRG